MSIQGLCFRCEKRAKFLETGNRDRSQCGVIESQLYSCYCYEPIKPILLEKSDKSDIRDITLDIYSSRIKPAEKQPSLNMNLEMIDNGLLFYWKPEKKEDEW